jgi:hypothetical protein
MTKETQTSQWKVEYEKDVLSFEDFVSALSYADGVAFENHLLRVIEPPENKIRLMPNYPASGPQMQPANHPM